jgi:hypothetical protein
MRWPVVTGAVRRRLLRADVRHGSGRSSRGHSLVAHHAGLHHPGSLRWPPDDVLVPVDAVCDWSRILGVTSGRVKARDRCNRSATEPSPAHR